MNSMSFAIVSLRFQPIHIQVVTPTTYFASTRTRRQTPHRRSVKAAAAAGKPVMVLSSRAGHVTPLQLRGLYKTFTYVPTAADRNTLGSGNLHCRAGEWRQYTSAMAYPTPIIFYSISGSEKWLTDGSEPLPGDADLESLDYLLKKTDNPPWRSYVEVLVGVTEAKNLRNKPNNKMVGRRYWDRNGADEVANTVIRGTDEFQRCELISFGGQTRGYGSQLKQIEKWKAVCHDRGQEVRKSWVWSEHWLLGVNECRTEATGACKTVVSRFE
ncbi:hypothetical protein EDB84DRAFT_1444984 [Lactarius hengduanensis]|nr:hypothetical protein EDB84DRAFT_1444984 [Lactarius hengduanensis]